MQRIFIQTWTPSQCLNNTAIILLHDSLGSVHLWRDFPEQLAQITQQKVIAYDRLGFGQSSAHLNTLNHDFVVTEATQTFEQILQELDVQKFIVMGHSVGGGMASVCAATYPDQCVGLITIAAQACVEELTLSGIKEAKQMFAQDGQLDRLRKYHGEKAQWVLDAWTETWLSDDFKNWSLRSFIEKIQSPMLVIHGELDEYGSLNQPQQFIDYSPSVSQLRIMKNTHHMPHKENPKEVLTIIQKFITDVINTNPQLISSQNNLNQSACLN